MGPVTAESLPPIAPPARYTRVWPVGDVAGEVLTLLALERPLVHIYRVDPADVLDDQDDEPAALAEMLAEHPRDLGPFRVRVRGYRTLVLDDPRPWARLVLVTALEIGRPWVRVVVLGLEVPPTEERTDRV